MKPARITEQFLRQLRSQYDLHRAENPDAADRVRRRVLSAVERLESFPESGRAWMSPGTRELILPGLPLVIVYRVLDDYVEILSLLHTARETPDVH
jgi:toxin ParE1/3/4